MTLILAFLPIVIVMAGFVIGFIIKNNANKRKTLLTSHSVFLFMGGYLAVLLVATILFFSIPDEEYTPVEVFSQDFSYERMHSDVYDAAYRGEIEEVDEEYVADRREFPFEHNQLDVVSVGAEHMQVSVFVERKDVNDGIVEATTYVIPPTFEGIELPDFQETHQLVVREDILEVIQPARVEYNLIKFDNEFVITQFTGEERMGLNVSSYEMVGNELIYLRIPKNLSIGGEVQMTEDFQ